MNLDVIMWPAGSLRVRDLCCLFSPALMEGAGLKQLSLVGQLGENGISLESQR